MPTRGSLLWCASLSLSCARSPTSDRVEEITGARSAPRPFLVFTTQRSGSQWTMDLLGSQEGIGTPADGGEHSESMLPTHRANVQQWKSFKWQAWRDEAERAFANVSARNPAALAVGWKLMYNHVPAQLTVPFVEWVRNSSIRVVHLVREASLLQHLSSDEARRTNVYHARSGGEQTTAAATAAAIGPPVTQTRGVPVQLNTATARRTGFPPSPVPLPLCPTVPPRSIDARAALQSRVLTECVLALYLPPTLTLALARTLRRQVCLEHHRKVASWSRQLQERLTLTG